jgi:hypothetical protein
VRSVGKPRAAHNSYRFAARDRLSALSQHRRHQAEVAVDANETLVLDQNLEASDAVPMNSENTTWRNSHHSATRGRWNIDATMERTSKPSMRKNPGSKR